MNLYELSIRNTLLIDIHEMSIIVYPSHGCLHRIPWTSILMDVLCMSMFWPGIRVHRTSKSKGCPESGMSHGHLDCHHDDSRCPARALTVTGDY